jgi:hypothetical protein
LRTIAMTHNMFARLVRLLLDGVHPEPSAGGARELHVPWEASNVGGILHMSGSIRTIRDCSRSRRFVTI